VLVLRSDLPVRLQRDPGQLVLCKMWERISTLESENGEDEQQEDKDGLKEKGVLKSTSADIQVHCGTSF